MVTTLITVAMLAANKPSIYYGPEAKLGQGTVKSYVAMNAAGDPTAVGLIMTEAALEGLPNTKPAEGDGYELVLSLPKETKSTVFNHIGVDWNPVGHVPIGVYNVPHFDFHFYMMSESARKQITLKEDDMKRCQEKPPADMIPEGLRGQPRLLATKCDLCYTSATGPACVNSCPHDCAMRISSIGEFQTLIVKEA